MALPIIRLLGRKQIPVTAVFGKGKDLSPFNKIIAQSNYISEKIFFDEANYSESLIKSLVEYGNKQNSKPVLFLASDTDLEVVSSHRDKLHQYYHFTLPPDYRIKEILNKDKFISLARDYNLPVPKSLRITLDLSPEKILGLLNFPFIVKPSWRDNRWLKKFREKKVFIIKNSDELKLTLNKLKEFPVEYLAQEIISGPESNIFCSFSILNKNSDPIESGFCRKLTQYPPDFGNTSIAAPVNNEELKKLSDEIFRKLKLTGYASIEFKFDEKDRQFKVIEVTPNRFNRQFAVTSMLGLNLPYILYQYELEREILPQQLKSSDRLWLSEVNEVRRILKYEKTKTKALIKFLLHLPKVGFFEIFDVFDLKPFFNLLVKRKS
ncbi:hypothetical protein [Ignavibacterium sp.]|uniref:carboxylate--amine ligase n=1 Tax=Ignavibacterium sp. TaxID=2651167 RepID=UPI00307F199E